MSITDADNRAVLDYNGSTGAVLRWYAYGMGPNAVLNRMDVAAGTRTTLIPDIQNTIVAALDSGGALTKTGNLAYGENPNNSADGPLYTGQHLDAETAGSAAQPSGLYYYRARVYSPALGRFMQPDPIRYAGGPNLYAYVGNDPLNNTDPSGELAAPYHFGITLFAGLAAGSGFTTSLSLAWNAAAADIGTQAPAQANMHAMIVPGQSPAQASASTQEFIRNQIQQGNLGVAAHTIQDMYSPSHQGEVWNGFSDMSWSEIAKHITADVLPGWENIVKAYQDTRDMLKAAGSSEKPNTNYSGEASK